MVSAISDVCAGFSVIVSLIRLCCAVDVKCGAGRPRRGWREDGTKSGTGNEILLRGDTVFIKQDGVSYGGPKALCVVLL